MTTTPMNLIKALNMEPIPHLKAAASAAASPPPEILALVIDDSSAVRTMTSAVLRRLGYRVQQAVDGREGLQMLKDGTFAVVICDFEMPEMNGFDCVRHFRIWEHDCRDRRQAIFCFTGRFNPGLAETGKEAGMDVVMEKPFSKSKLECALEQVASSLNQPVPMIGAGTFAPPMMSFSVHE